MTPIELSDFWTEVIENNNGFEVKEGGDWYDNDDGPTIISQAEYWRAKPKRKSIDMNRVADSGYDVEWGNGHGWVMVGDGKLNKPPLNNTYNKYRIRQNHIHYFSTKNMPPSNNVKSEELGLPEGLKLSELHYAHGLLVGFKVDGCIEGWSYE